MKKLIYSSILMVLAFFAASCQQENLEPVVGGETVSYIVQIPDVIATRAVSDGFTVYYEVYRELDITDPDKTPIYSGSEAFESGSNKLELQLQFVKNQKFIVLFWAQKNGSGYGISNLRNVTMPATLTANNIDLEVFAGTDKVDNCVSAANGDVTLTRPIAQINIGTTAQSLTLGILNVALQQSSVVVKGLSNTYNVATKAVGIDNSTFTYTQTNVPAGTFPVNGVVYNYVAMNYVGFVAETGDNVDIDLVIKTSEANEILHKISNVPVKPNYKTNIVGNLITATADYDVSINDIWAPEENNAEVVTVSNAVDLQEAIANIQDGTTGNIQLNGDIDLGMISTSTKGDAPRYGLLIPEDKSLILDLNGCTISQEVQCTASYSMIENNGTLTIADSKSNGKISFKDTGAGDSTFGWGSYTIFNNGTLVVNSGTIEHTGEHNTLDSVRHMYCAIQQNNADAVTTINGGTISNNTYRSIRISNGTANIKGGNLIGQVWVQPADENVVLNIEYGNFRPSGVDMSSVFIENDSRDVTFAVTGGFFSTKIGCSLPDNLAGTVTGGTFTALAKENTPAPLYAGYQFVQDGENYILERLADVAKIGETGYYSIQAAVNAVQDGETITLIDDVEQTDGVLITDKKITVDLNEKTFTVTEGASTVNRNFMINGSSVVTIKNGTMVAAGNYSSGAYGTVRTEGTANVTLEDLLLYNYRGNGLNVKALSGTTVTISNTEIYSEYGGGVEAAGGEVVLNNVTVQQKGMYTAPYNSMAISVNGGGTATVNSGTYSTECLTAEEANNQGTSHGPWCAGVLNSGGTLIINDGTFSNDNFGDDALATAARGLLLADTGAEIEINGGTFNAVKAIVDVTNNLGDTSKQPSVTLAGGDFSADPCVSGLYASDLISVLEGMEVVEGDDGRFTLVKAQQSNEIWYTSTEMKLEPTTPTAFNANIVSNVWDSTTGKGVITFDAPLTAIGNEAFKRITNTTPSDWMTSISLPNSLETIGNYAFYQCFSLTSITIPDSVESIGQYAFSSCNAATNITIGSGVTTIASAAFRNCYEVTEIISKAIVPPAVADNYVFDGLEKLSKVIVPASSVDAYEAADFWKDLNIVAE